MTKRNAATVASIIALLLAAHGARAVAQDAPTFNAAQVPAEGRRAQDFVPRGWQIGASVAGDLNGDGAPDQVLHIVPQGYDAAGISAAPEAQALLVLLSAPGGGLRRAALTTRLLVPVVPQYILDLSIKNGVLVVHQNYGMTDVIDLTHRFRYDPAAGRFLLIGKDTFNYHRPQGPDWPATRVSENYLTGVRLTTIDRWLRNGTNRPTTTRAAIARTRLALEDVDEVADN